MDWSSYTIHDQGEMLVIKHVRIPMVDGTLLASDLYVPRAFLTDPNSRLPVVMDYIPYRKDEVATSGWGGWYYKDIAKSGYVLARVDVRGTGSSQGLAMDEYSEQEQADGYAAVEWFASQQWCSGHVSMMGISYGAFTSLQVACLAPPSLTTIIPMYFSDDRYEADHYAGGLLRLWFDLGYYGSYLTAYSALPPDPLLDGWEEMWATRLADRQRAAEPYIVKWLKEQCDGPYWRTGSVRGNAERISCPVFMIGGWRDAYPSAPLRLFQELRVPKRMLIGPWNHAVPDIAIPGPRIDYAREVIGWLDRWCKGEGGPSDEPPVTVFMQRFQRPDPRRLDAPGDWRSERSWPPAGQSTKTLHLDGGRLRTHGGEHAVDRLEYVPDAGVQAGLWCYMSFGQSGDQRRDEGLGLTYTSLPLDATMAVLGEPELTLEVATDATVIAVVAALSDVSPQGESELVTKGRLNATRRDSLTAPTAVVPGERMTLRMALDATGWTFGAGHRIRLTLTSADWPNLWPTPQPGFLDVHSGSSVLRLPVVPLEAEDSHAPSLHGVETAVVAPSPSVWRVTRDLGTGLSTFELKFAREYEADSGTRTVRREFELVAAVDPDDPASARAHGTHRSEIVIGSRKIAAKSRVSVRGSEDSLLVDVGLTAAENGEVRFAKRWTRRIDRMLL